MLFLEPFKLPKEAPRASGKSVKIIVAGLPRTGTASLKLALQNLGIGPCHHLADPPNQYGRLRLAAEILNTVDKEERHKMLAELFQGCEAILEQPVTPCLPDLLEMYPNAKIILTERTSANLWIQSWHASIGYTRTWSWRIVGYLMPSVKSTSDIYRAWTRISAARFGIVDDVTEDLYHSHNAWVKAIVPREKLLVYRAEMGYEPLCKFLGLEMPEGQALIPFSSRSERNTFQLYRRLAMSCGAIAWILIAACLWSMWILLWSLPRRHASCDLLQLCFFLLSMKVLKWGREILNTSEVSADDFINSESRGIQTSNVIGRKHDHELLQAGTLGISVIAVNGDNFGKGGCIGQ